MSTAHSTLDRFLGGRLRIVQPKRGFRAGHDSVLLAASVPAEPASTALELGAGAGVASLCLAWRVPGCRILGIEIDPELVTLANQNAALNAMSERVRFEAGEAASAPEQGRSFDHVFFNPPFHPASGQEAQSAARGRAMRDFSNAIVGQWTRIALALVKPGGTVTAIVRADRTEDILSAGEGRAAIVFPLLPHDGETPKRAIVQFRDGRCEISSPPGLVLHEDDGRNTEAAEAVLRHGSALRLI